MATIYDPGELALACKPLVLEAVLGRVGEPCAYVDADVTFSCCLGDLGELLGDAAFAVTPHLNGVWDEVEPPIDDTLLLISGAFNAGFVVVGPASRDFLQWWEARCRRDCVRDPEHHLFMDQRWLDLAAAQFPCRVIRDPGYNVAYWNIAQRHLEGDDGALTVEGSPLRFFHFSGFDRDRPDVLSTYTDDEFLDRIGSPQLDALVADYASALERARPRASQPATYPFAVTANGLHLDLTIRRLAREALKAHEDDGASVTLPDPFDPEGAASFVAWLNEPTRPSEGGPMVTRYVDGRWRNDAQAQRRFSDPQALASWLGQDPSVDPILADAIGDAPEHPASRSVRALVAQARVEVDHEVDAGAGRWASVAARRGLLRVLAYYDDELRRRDARVADQLGRAILNLEARIDALERLEPPARAPEDRP